MGRRELPTALLAVLLAAAAGCSGPTGTNVRDIGGRRYEKKASPAEGRRGVAPHHETTPHGKGR